MSIYKVDITVTLIMQPSVVTVSVMTQTSPGHSITLFPSYFSTFQAYIMCIKPDYITSRHFNER